MEVAGRPPGGPDRGRLSYEDPAVAGQGRAKVAKEQRQVRHQGRLLDGKVLDQRASRPCPQMPGKDELRAMLLATFNAVPQNFVALLIAAPQNFMYLLAPARRS